MSRPDLLAYPTLKRAIDAVLASVALIVLAPLLAVVALAVAIALGRPVLFRQARAGRHGTTFTLLKFRTMRDVDESRGLVTDAQRLTRFGSFLRSTSLDELPSLINIVRGDMSVIGPRPLLCHYLDRYTAEQARRHEVRPGLTGLAQVSGRNELAWAERFRLDVHYVDSVRATTDLRILLLTIVVVLRRSGITAEGHVASPEFAGSRETVASPLAVTR